MDPVSPAAPDAATNGTPPWSLDPDPVRFRVVSTFSGCGGSSLGYRYAGGKVLLAVEWDDHAAATYRLNFPGTRLFHGDVAKVTLEDALSGLQPGELDVLDGSPPCQGFSTTGRRKFGDERNQLFREYVRLLRGLRPRAFVMENVSGMVKGKMKLLFAEILRELRGAGYVVRAKLLTASWYGVPQIRQRVIFLGVREDLGVEPAFPVPNARPVTVREAWRGLPPQEGERLPENMLHVMRWTRPGERGNKYHPKGHYFSSQRLAWDRPAPTVTASHGRVGYAVLVHPDEERSISIAEARRLGTFPDDFRFPDADPIECIKRVGNSVPPLFMRAIAEALRDRVLEPARGKP